MLASSVVSLVWVFTHHSQACEALIRASQTAQAGTHGSQDGTQNLLIYLESGFGHNNPALPDASLKFGLSSTPEPTRLELGLGQHLSRPDSQSSISKPRESNDDGRQTVASISSSSQRQTYGSSQQVTPENFPKRLRGWDSHQYPPDSSIAENCFAPLQTLPKIPRTITTERANWAWGMGGASSWQETQTNSSKQQKLGCGNRSVSTRAPSLGHKSPQAGSWHPGINDLHYPHDFLAANQDAHSSGVPTDTGSLNQATLGKLIAGSDAIRKDPQALGFEEREMDAVEPNDQATLAAASSKPEALQREALVGSQKTISGGMAKWHGAASYYHFKHKVPLEMLLSSRMLEDNFSDMEIIYEDSSSVSHGNSLDPKTGKLAAGHHNSCNRGEKARPSERRKIIQKFYPEEKALRKQHIENSEMRRVPFKFYSESNKATFERILRKLHPIKKIVYGDEVRYPNPMPDPGRRYRKIWREANHQGQAEMKELNLGPKFQPDRPFIMLPGFKKRKAVSNPHGQNFQNARALMQHVIACVIHDIRVLFEAFPDISAKNPIKEIQREAWEFYNHIWHHIEEIYAGQDGKALWENQSLMSHQNFVRLVNVFETQKLAACTRDSLSIARRLLLLWMSCNCKALYPHVIKLSKDGIFLNVVGMLNEFYDLHGMTQDHMK